MTDTIATIEQLEAVVGVAPLGVKMKIIDHIDAGAAAWIAKSCLAFAGFATSDAPLAATAGGPPGFATVRDKSTLLIPRGALDPLMSVEPGQGAGVLFLVPGIGETLRVNGRVATVDDRTIEIKAEECFLHCAKALIRSSFWGATPGELPVTAGEFLNRARFLALVTTDAGGRVDISPKGDPAGLLIRHHGETATLAERPGNRLAFGYRNMIERPAVAAIALIPGGTHVVTLTGKAHLSTSETVRRGFEVDGKIPILGTVIEDVAMTLGASDALAQAGLWPSKQAPAELDPSAMLVAHLKLNKTRGLAAKAMRAAANRLIVAKGLEQSYKHTLY